jgi:hypothetical protein
MSWWLNTEKSAHADAAGTGLVGNFRFGSRLADRGLNPSSLGVPPAPPFEIVGPVAKIFSA